jgi:hypothetical protein
MGGQQSTSSTEPIAINQYNELSVIMNANKQYQPDIMNSILGTKVSIINKANKSALSESGFALYLYANDNPNSQWSIENHSPGFFKLKNLAYNTYAQYAAWGIALNPFDPLDASFKFRFTITPDGFLIQPAQAEQCFGRVGNDCCRLAWTNVADGITDNQRWYIVLRDQMAICAAMNKNYAFSIPACRMIPKTDPLYQSIAQGYAAQKVANKSILMSDQLAQTWCNDNPTQCESVMLSYCNANPTAPECQCVFADNQADYLAFKAKYPKIVGQASCFTKACQGTNFATTLIPASVAATKCPDITSIEQTTNQNLIAQAGSTVINPTMNATQNATATTTSTTKNVVSGAPVSAPSNVPVGSTSSAPNSSASSAPNSSANQAASNNGLIIFFIFLIFLIISGLGIFLVMNMDETDVAIGNPTQMAALDELAQVAVTPI